MPPEKLLAKVAAIVTPTTLLLNRGQNDGIRKGMKFAIFYKIGPITDPEDPTNTLEFLRFRKGTVTVSQVYDRMSYCTIDPIYTSRVDPLIGSGTFFSTRREAHYPEVGSPLYAKEDKVIRIGDVAEEIEEVSTQEKKAAG